MNLTYEISYRRGGLSVFSPDVASDDRRVEVSKSFTVGDRSPAYDDCGAGLDSPAATIAAIVEVVNAGEA